MTPQEKKLGSENDSTSSGLDLLLSNATDELGLHDNRFVDMASAQKLEHSVLGEVDHRSLGGILGSLLLSLSGNQTPNLIEVHGGAVVSLTVQVVVSHTDLSEVSRVARKVRERSQITYNLSKRMRRCCRPPALPRPEGWQRCLPTHYSFRPTPYQYDRDQRWRVLWPFCSYGNE